MASKVSAELIPQQGGVQLHVGVQALSVSRWEAMASISLGGQPWRVERVTLAQTRGSIVVRYASSTL